jgi:hypothetical protein
VNRCTPRRAAFAALVSALSILSAAGQTGAGGLRVPARDPLPDGGEAVLFAFDDHSIPNRRNLYLTMQPAEKHPQNPIVRRGAPGSPDDARLQFHGTVLRIDGKFRMWYLAMDEEGLRNYGSSTWYDGYARVCYAESTDGIHWTKPSLGLVDYRGSKSNNVIALEGVTAWPSIRYEPEEPDPTKRYKMIFKATGGRLKGLLDRYPGFDYLVSPLCAYSADGLRWRLAEHNPLLRANMEGTNFYRFNGSYVLQGHIPAQHSASVGMLPNGEPTGRVLFTYQSPDLVHWSVAPALSLMRHGYRSAPQATVEEAHTSCGAWARGNVVLSVYLQWHGNVERDLRWMDVGFMLSNDGLHFREPIPDFQLLSRGPKGSWEGGSLWGVSFLNVDDRTFIYYSGLDGGGSTALGRGDIGLATLPRDRFGHLSLKDTRDAGNFESCLLDPGAAARLYANVDGLDSGATVRVGLLDERFRPVPGYGLADSVPLTVSGLRREVAWKAGPLIKGLGGKKVRLTGELSGSGGKSPRLFALYLEAAK